MAAGIATVDIAEEDILARADMLPKMGTIGVALGTLEVVAEPSALWLGPSTASLHIKN